MTDNTTATMRDRAADVLWRNRSTKGRIGVIVAAFVLVAAIGGAGGADTADADRNTAPTPSTAAPTTAKLTTTAKPSTTTTSTTTTTAPATTAAPTTTAPTTTAPLPGERVARIIDGDTVEMADGAKVRLIGIDTPERGECGYREATEQLRSLIARRPVILRGGARDDSDHYGRLLRYIDIGTTDVNLEMIRSGWANARYDSRDGYGHHLREDAYIAADAATPHRCGNEAPRPGGTSSGGGGGATPTTAAPPAAGTDPKFRTCKDAIAAGYGPYRRGLDPEYDWYRDADSDGVVCE